MDSSRPSTCMPPKEVDTQGLAASTPRYARQSQGNPEDTPAGNACCEDGLPPGLWKALPRTAPETLLTR
eukprot:9948461-Alexandrium_andersonii.AAC.1